MGRGANRAGSPAGRAHGRRSVCRSRSPARQDQPASSTRRPPVLASATTATTGITAPGSQWCGRRRLRCALHPTANDQGRRGDEERAHADGRRLPRGHAGRRTLRERTRARSPPRPRVPGGEVLPRQCRRIYYASSLARWTPPSGRFIKSRSESVKVIQRITAVCRCSLVSGNSR